LQFMYYSCMTTILNGMFQEFFGVVVYTYDFEILVSCGRHL